MINYASSPFSLIILKMVPEKNIYIIYILNIKSYQYLSTLEEQDPFEDHTIPKLFLNKENN
jgi:hypothetical protein